MKINIADHTTKIGYSDDDGGFSYSFSWWRSSIDYRLFSVCSHVPGFGLDGKAVMDDFGTLQRVSS